LGCKLTSTTIEANVDMWFDGSHTLDHPRRYRRWIEKLIYLTITRPYITFVVRVLSRFMHQHREDHWTTALRIMAYVKSSLGKGLLYRKHEQLHISEYSDSNYVCDKGNRKSITIYCIFVRGNLVTWRSKKQDVVSRSSAEAEYRELWLILFAR